jgi:hypothetical protein
MPSIEERITSLDYVPSGKKSPWSDTINWRGAIFGRCVMIIGNDIQSGPIFCGKPALVMSDVKGGNGVVYLCERCARSLGIPPETRKEIDKLLKPVGSL